MRRSRVRVFASELQLESGGVRSRSRLGSAEGRFLWPVFMFNALKDALFEAYASKLLIDAGKMTSANSTNSSNTDFAQYVGPYKIEKTLGKGQTGKHEENLVCTQTFRHQCIQSDPL